MPSGKLGDYAATLQKSAHVQIEGTLRSKPYQLEVKGSTSKKPLYKTITAWYIRAEVIRRLVDGNSCKPRDVDLLLSLPGLGPIIASTILSEAHVLFAREIVTHSAVMPALLLLPSKVRNVEQSACDMRAAGEFDKRFSIGPAAALCLIRKVGSTMTG